MLLRAGNRDYAGAGIHYVVVVDQEGVLRAWANVTSPETYSRVNEMVDALINRRPVISLFPDPTRGLFFARTLEVGQSKTVELEIRNTGTGPLEITGYGAPDGITMTPETLTIGPGETATVQITLTPTQPGTFSGSLTLEHGDQSVGTLRVPVRGLTIEMAPLPSIALIQESLSLGEIEVGNRITKTFTIDNSGTGPLTVTDIRSDIAGITFSETQFTVPAGQSHVITVTFNPQAEGTFDGTIDIQSDDPQNATISLTLTGSVTGPLKRSDFDESGKIDFSDFLLFAGAFGTANEKFDLDNSGSVDFPDFLLFVANFGKSVN